MFLFQRSTEDQVRRSLYENIRTLNVSGVKQNVDKMIRKGWGLDVALEASRRTPIFEACGYKDTHGSSELEEKIYNIVEIFVENKVDLEVRDKEGDTCLLVAVILGRFKVCQILAENGADVNVVSHGLPRSSRPVNVICKSGDSPLHIAAENNYVRIVKILLENKADIELKNKTGETCLMVAIKKGNSKLVKFLIEKGADLNAQAEKGQTIAHIAAKNRQLECLDLLINNGADLAKENKSGDDILQSTCLSTDIQVFEHLVKAALYSDERLADALDLIGSASILHAFNFPPIRESDINKGVSFWKRAMKIRGKNPVIKLRRPKLAFKKTFEITKIVDLEDVEEDFSILYLQAVLKYYRILSPLHFEVEFELQQNLQENLKRSNVNVDVLKLLMEIIFEKRGFNHEESRNILNTANQFFLDNLNLYYAHDFGTSGGPKSITSLDVLDVIKFITLKLEEGIQEIGFTKNADNSQTNSPNLTESCVNKLTEDEENKTKDDLKESIEESALSEISFNVK